MSGPDPYALFEGNRACLRDRELAERLAAPRPDFSAPVHYRFMEARNGDPVPAIASRPLHSLFDPRREGERLVSTLDGEDFLIVFGFGGAYHVEAALARPETDQVVVVEFGLRGFAELLGLRDLRGLIADPRLRLLVDPPPGALERLIPDLYLPALSRAIRTLPLRPRVEGGAFAAAAAEVRSAIGRISADYSVQAHFGIRMFKNTLRNLLGAETGGPALPRICRAVVCAAGPSLDSQLPRIAEARGRKGAPFLIATDTSLPALLSGALEPDAVISIDCQHIGYRHFIPPRRSRPCKTGAVQAASPGAAPLIPPHIPLFLDLASPPSLASLAARPVFCSAGHPLTAYIASSWRPFPRIDGSGGNVTHAAVSLAESLGAAEIELYGADFSYPLGRTYARGTYIFPYFDTSQNRLGPLETYFSRLLYRGPLEKGSRDPAGKAWYYQTETLTRYRESLEAAGERMEARLLPAAGLGAPIAARTAARRDTEPRAGPWAEPWASPWASPWAETRPDAPRLSAREFLGRYREQIRALPPAAPGTPAGTYLAGLGNEGRRILATLLPLAASLRQREPERDGVIGHLKDYAAAAIDRVLAAKL
ncbi:MAG: DUF115 domain-containing protein [Treponema sp.]|jgi:hypothetical protein|nr:DUF115 domain-containing protein [Treponema sp.]